MALSKTERVLKMIDDITKCKPKGQQEAFKRETLKACINSGRHDKKIVEALKQELSKMS